MSKTTKTILWVIAAIIVIGLVWYAVSKKPETVTKEEETIKIGATIALTGPLSYKGIYEMQGLQMAVDEINSTGGINGKKLQLIAENNEGDSNKAVTSVHKLIEVDRVSAILTAFTNISAAVAPIITAANNVLIYQSTISSLAKESDNIFKDYYSMADVGKNFAQAAFKEGVKNIGLLYPVSEWGTDFENGFKNEAEKLGLNIAIIEAFNASNTDIKTEILKIKAQDVDAIASAAFDNQNMMIFKALNDLNFLDIKLFMVELLTDAIKNDPVSMNVISQTHAISSWYFFDPNDTSPKIKNFVQKYRAKFNEDPNPNVVYFYDDVYVLANALRVCDKQNQITSQCLIAELKQVKNYDGVAGPMSFDANGISDRPTKLFQFNNNKWEEYKLE